MCWQIGVADYKYLFSDDPLPPGHVTRRMRIVIIVSLKWPIDIAFIHYSATNQARSIKVGSMHRWISTQITFMIQMWRRLASRETSKYCEMWPLITFDWNRAIRFKFGKYIECCVTGHKTTPTWAWARLRDPISKYWDPFITFKGIELSASNLVSRYRTDP